MPLENRISISSYVLYTRNLPRFDAAACPSTDVFHAINNVMTATDATGRTPLRIGMLFLLSCYRTRMARWKVGISTSGYHYRCKFKVGTFGIRLMNKQRPSPTLIAGLYRVNWDDFLDCSWENAVPLNATTHHAHEKTNLGQASTTLLNFTGEFEDFLMIRLRSSSAYIKLGWLWDWVLSMKAAR